MNQRAKFATSGIDINTKTGLELGPLTMPTVKKGKGVKIFYLDHLSTDDLKKKYKDEPINPDDIVSVDYVMNGTIKNSVKSKKFDYVIASHVIEHIPNTIAWFREIEQVLNSDGLLSLVIPDKRYTFDIYRSVSRPSAVIGAYIDGISRFTAEMVYDASASYMKDIDAPSIWRDPEYYTKIIPKHRWTEKEALELARRSAAGEYIDTHCYVYTPVSFLEIMKALIQADLINFTVERFAPTPVNEIEFYIILKKIPKYTEEAKRKEITKINRLIKSNLEEPPYIKKMRELEVERDTLRNQLNLIKNGLLWRVSKPLRYSKQIIRNKTRNQD
jgi:SAM-dependent methyltransferase